MQTTTSRVVHNVVLRVLGYSLGAALNFGIVILIARYLGTHRFGHFVLIQSCVSLGQLLADMGLRTILMRDIARQRQRVNEYLGVAKFVLRVLLLCGGALLLLLVFWLPLAAELRLALGLAGLAALVTVYSLAYSAVLRAFEDMQWDIGGFVLHKVVWLLGVAVSIGGDLGLAALFAALLVANLCQYMVMRMVVARRHGRAPCRSGLPAAWAMLREALPLGIMELGRRALWHIDKIFLAVLSTPMAVGTFSAAYKFLETMQPFTLNLTLPLFPVFARLERAPGGALTRALEHSLKLLCALVLPLAILLFTLATPIITRSFGGAYGEAATVLRILAPIVFLLPLTSVYGYLYTALGQQRLAMRFLLLALLLNLLLDLLLIPRYSSTGAALATLTTEVCLFAAQALGLAQLGIAVTHLRVVWRPLLAGSGMAACCWLGGTFGSVVAGVLAGVLLYGLLVLRLHMVTRQELGLMAQALRWRTGRGPGNDTSPVRATL